jgi:Flp pilus assembly pilin Flp
MNLFITLLLLLGTGLFAYGFSLASARRRSALIDNECSSDHISHISCHQSGQATTEYALVLLGAALIALILITWATTGGAEGRIGQLFDTVIDSITSRI